MGKRATEATPNLLLRRARQERGWTQKAVAERIGAPNDVIVTRWESGTAFPSAFYVERLCQLFGQQASDLGLLKERHPLSTTRPHPQQVAAYSNQHMSIVSSGSSRLASLPLIGRDSETYTLQSIFQDVQQGQTRMILIQGEAGIGKTHLAATFMQWAATQGAMLLQGRAFEIGGHLPYQPLVHILNRRIEEEQDLESWLSTTWLSELSRILPGLHDRYPSLPRVTGDEITGRIRLFEAVTRLIQGLCERAPTILFIDDIQWADTASRDVLHYMVQRCNESDTPLLLLLSLRSEALAIPNAFKQWIKGLYHNLSVTDLVLAPLSHAETRHLLEALGTQRRLSDDQQQHYATLAQWLFSETQGQPFYLIETLKMLQDHQIIKLRPTTQGDVLELDLTSLDTLRQQRLLAPNVRRLILSQLDQLTTMERALLTASAILGYTASFDLLCHVLDVETHIALPALERILQQGLLREVNAEKDQIPHYCFGHDKIREVIATEMSAAQRRHLHQRAFQILAAHAQPAADLAHHAQGAGLSEQAIHFSLAAGDEAVRLFANAEAYAHYTQTLDGLSRLPETTATWERRVETTLKLVQVSWMTVDIKQTLQRLNEAEQLAQTLHDQKMLAYIHYWIAVVYGTRNTMRQARTYAERVLLEAQALADEDLVALSSLQLSRVLVLQGQYDRVEPLLLPIIPTLERAENWLDWTYALGYLGVAYAARGHYAQGVAQGQRLVERARHAGELQRHIGLKARHFLSNIYLHSHNLLAMLEESNHVVGEIQRSGEQLFIYWACSFRGWAQVRLGRYEEAAQNIAHAQSASQKLGKDIMGQDILEAVTAELLLAQGQIEQALERAMATVHIATEEVGGILSAGLAERVWGQALEMLGRWDEAQEHLSASVQTLHSGEALVEAARTQAIWTSLRHEHEVLLYQDS